MPSVARTLVFSALVVPFAALAACSGGEAPADAGLPDAARTEPASCTYRDFRGNDVVCPGDRSPCPSRDGCNSYFCDNGALGSTLQLCGCNISPHRVNGSAEVSYGTQTADDGCTVCTCGIYPDGGRVESGVTCDSSACK